MKITDKHFKFFKKECRKFIDRLHLDNYKVYFQLGGQNKGAFSTTFVKNVYVATICLTKEWDETGSEGIWKGLSQTAKHEVIHILLGRYSCVASWRHSSEDDLNEAEEELVRKLEKLIEI